MSASVVSRQVSNIGVHGVILGGFAHERLVIVVGVVVFTLALLKMLRIIQWVYNPPLTICRCVVRLVGVRAGCCPHKFNFRLRLPPGRSLLLVSGGVLCSSFLEFDGCLQHRDSFVLKDAEEPLIVCDTGKEDLYEGFFVSKVELL